MTDVINARAQSNSGRNAESGATLILALIFLLVFSLIIGALANWTSTGLGSALKFQNASSKYYAAEGVTQVAVRQLRYDYPVPSSGPQSFECPLNVAGNPPSAQPLTINSVWIEDWCQISQAGDTLRVATVTACLVTSGSVTLTGPCTPTSSASKLLSTQVTFTDHTTTPAPTSPTCTTATLSYCGVSMAFNNWNAY